MPWSAWAGGALIILLLVDVFFTVLHPQAHGGPVNRLIMRVVWQSFRGMGSLLRGSARDRWLSLAAPALSAVVLITWAALLIVGFALVYGAYPAAFTHTEWVSEIGWGEAFYFSGISASTLGMGDVLVEPGWLRALTVVEALFGFMLISLSAAYILSIYSAQSAASSFAMEVWGALGDDTDEGVRRIVQDLDAADEWAQATATRLARLTTDHSQYPILHYFRPPDHRQAVVPQAGRLLMLFRRLEERPGWEVGHPSLLMLRNILGRYLEEVSRRFASRTGIDMGAREEEDWIDLYRQALRHLGYTADAPLREGGY